jgi:RNA methyltransferase, TrmH family
MRPMQPPKSRAITSTKNPVVAHFRDAAGGDVADVLFAEGVRLCAEGVAAGLPIVDAAISPRLKDAALREQLTQRCPQLAECSDEVLARMSALDTHQGVVVLFGKPSWRPEDLLRGNLAPLVLLAAGVRDPGNLGALLRTAEAAGATGLIALQGGADPFREKAVRGSMGSVFRLPVLAGVDAEQAVAFARRHRLQLVVAEGEGELDYVHADLRKPTMLVVGAEAAGVPEPLRKAADQRATIPIVKPVESLNVAVAAGVLLFEARRQRR